MTKRKTIKEVVDAFRDVWGNEYDYSLITEYKNNKEKLPIVCRKHGVFFQSFADHSKHHGCPKCADEKTGDRCRMPISTFIERATNVFDGYYDYSLINKDTYKGYNIKVPIVCPIHGVFYQTPHEHLSGRNCYKCGKKNMADKQRYTRDELVELFRNEFGDKYDYSLFKEEDYINRKSKINVICPKHGLWKVSVSNHLYRHSGCPLCKHSLGEERVSDFLNHHKIPFETQYCFKNESLLCSNVRIIVDFYLKEKDVVIEFNGAQHYKEVPFFNERNLEQQQERDFALRLYCHNHKIKLIEIPYTEIDNIESILSKKLKIK